MENQPVWVLILLTITGVWFFYQGVRIWIKRANGYFDVFLGIALIVTSLFMIRHGHIYPPVTDQLEPLLAPIWTLLTQIYAALSAFWNRLMSFDVENLSK
jgi:hypothetical protein